MFHFSNCASSVSNIPQLNVCSDTSVISFLWFCQVFRWGCKHYEMFGLSWKIAEVTLSSLNPHVWPFLKFPALLYCFSLFCLLVLPSADPWTLMVKLVHSAAASFDKNTLNPHLITRSVRKKVKVTDDVSNVSGVWTFRQLSFSDWFLFYPAEDTRYCSNHVEICSITLCIEHNYK